MKKKNAFTLIELLAVIVVLAIIALIATPIVMNTIKKSQKGAAERSADNYIDAVETTVATKRLDNVILEGEYTIQTDGNLCPTSGCGENDKDKVIVEMSGNKPSIGTITIKGGNVSKSGTRLVVGNYNVKYKGDKLTASEPYKGVLCKANTTKATALVWDGNAAPWEESSYTRKEVGILASESTSKYDLGVTYTCDLGTDDATKNLTFYVLKTNGDSISLIAGTNLGGTVEWVSKEDYIAAGGIESDYIIKNGMGGVGGNNNLGPITANKALKERTAAWTKLDEDQITLPMYDQIYKLLDNKKLPTWLSSCNKLNDVCSYWTGSDSSPLDSTTEGYQKALLVNYSASITTAYVNDSSATSGAGIRPVITVSKSNLY